MSNGYVIPFEDKLKCSICQDTLKDVRILSCGHTFCKGCIANFHRSKCPECQKSFRLPSGGVDGLPRCYVLGSLLDEISQTFRPDNTLSMSNHGFQAKEIFACSICIEPLRDARYLPCGHCFCLGCIRKQPSVAPNCVRCCKCLRDHDLPTGGITSLPTAYRIISITDVIRANREETESISSSTGHVTPPSTSQQPAPRPLWDDVAAEKARAQAQANRIQVFVRQVNGKTVTIDTKLSDNVGAFKKQIEAKIRVVSSQQSLSFNGRNLDENSRTLQSYGVVNHSNIQLNGRLRGGTDADQAQIDPMFKRTFL